MVCVAGRQIACPCADGTEGAQSCKADGSGYLACACAMGAGGESGAGGGERSAGGGERSAGGGERSAGGGERNAGGGERSGEAGVGSGGGGASGASGEAGASGAGEAGMPLECSQNAAALTLDRGLAALRALFASTVTFCLPQVTSSAESITVCTTAACDNTPNTCSAALASPTLSFDTASSGFTVTATWSSPALRRQPLPSATARIS